MAKRRRPGEFALIERYFAPLAAAYPGALGLADDAALIAAVPGRRLVATVDMLVAGVHFLPRDAPDLLARKLLRVNLSDLAAMGAEPLVYLLALGLPDDVDAAWLDSFAAGLAADQEAFGMRLAGGDTTATPGPMTLCLTAIGAVPEAGEIRRSTARPGEDVYVSGVIGDAALAVRMMAGAAEGAAKAFIDRYRLPQPRVALGPGLRGIATAAVDVSDGLVADLGHICETSGVGAEIEAARVPLSDAARRALGADPALIETVLTGGDDYELLFTVRPDDAGAVAEAATRFDVALTRIGRIVSGSAVAVIDEAGRPMTLSAAGYRHF